MKCCPLVIASLELQQLYRFRKKLESCHIIYRSLKDFEIYDENKKLLIVYKWLPLVTQADEVRACVKSYGLE